MDTREIASEYRLSHWAGIPQERISSGQSIREFCKTAGIAENVYYYRQRKLRETACEELATRAPQAEASLVPSGWAMCKPADSPASGKPIVIEVNGCRVYVEADTNPEQLKTICRALKSLC